MKPSNPHAYAPIILALLAICNTHVQSTVASTSMQETQLYVSTLGNDQWSGRLPAPNPSMSDGPVASLDRARDIIRELKNKEKIIGSVTVWIRGGTYYLDKTVKFQRQDSGTAGNPVIYKAYPNEKPRFVGGRRLSGFVSQENKLLSVTLPDVKNGDWYFRQLFVDGKRQIRARYPNFDSSDPHRAGFLHTVRCANSVGRKVGVRGTKGTWFEYNILIPKAGTYQVWVNYAHNMAGSAGYTDGMAAISLDGAEPILLTNLHVTGDWKKKFKWRSSASIMLTAGSHRMRWMNLKENRGVIGLRALVLSNDSKWHPGDFDLDSIQSNAQLVVIHAEEFEGFNGSFFFIDDHTDKHQFCYDQADAQVIENFSLNPETEVHIFPTGDCRAYNEIVHLNKVDQSKKTINISGKGCTAGIGIGNRYFLENSFDFLDTPGEWYLDKAIGKLYYYPSEAFTGATEVFASFNDRLLEFIGSKEDPIGYIQVEGLILSGTDPGSDDECFGYKICRNAVISFINAVECRVKGCIFKNIGKNAIYLEGGNNNCIDRNTIVQGAEGGIVMHDSWSNIISDNHISALGAIYKHIGAIVLRGERSNRNAIAHNRIHDITRYGILLSNAGQLNTIHHNYITTTNTETYDTGAITVNQHGNHRSSRSRIYNNIIADTIGYSHDGKKPIYLSWGIYLDSYASGYTVENNLVYDSSYGAIFIQGGKNNIVRNNIFAEANSAVATIANFKGASSEILLENNIFYSTRLNSKLLATNRLSTNTLRADNNLYSAGDNTIAIVHAAGIGGLEDWKKKGYDQNSLISDPMFINPAEGDFALTEKSEAFSTGFVKIDFSRVGVRPNELPLNPQDNAEFIQHD